MFFARERRDIQASGRSEELARLECGFVRFVRFVVSPISNFVSVSLQSSSGSSGGSGAGVQADWSGGREC